MWTLNGSVLYNYFFELFVLTPEEAIVLSKLMVHFFGLPVAITSRRESVSDEGSWVELNIMWIKLWCITLLCICLSEPCQIDLHRQQWSINDEDNNSHDASVFFFLFIPFFNPHCLSPSSEFYDSGALMMEEEGAVMGGLLVGLNVIDANLCIKGEDLDSQVGADRSHHSSCTSLSSWETSQSGYWVIRFFSSHRLESLTSPFIWKTLPTVRLQKSEYVLDCFSSCLSSSLFLL